MARFLREPPASHVIPSAAPAAPAPRWFAFQRGALVARRAASGALALPEGYTPAAAGLPAGEDAAVIRIGSLDGAPALLLELPDHSALPPGLATHGLRQVLLLGADDELQRAVGYASELAHWLRTSRHCPRCGQPAAAEPGDWGRRCPTCDFTHYPRVSPCVIVLIHDGPRILLARQPRFPPGMFGLVAGFVEPGESLEECVAREVAEEVGVQVSDLRYFRSQPWPFPHQLMVGFFARYAGGELRPDPTELAEAGWYTIGALPGLPPPVSVARQLIDHYVTRCSDGRGL